MKREIIAGIFILSFGLFFSTNTYAEVDPLTEIPFLQTGAINTDENQFQISNDIQIREFSNGKIIRMSGHTIEGFPYITYSKIIDDEIKTHGIIYVGGEFMPLSFEEKTTQENITEEDTMEKEDDLQILVQYTQRVYSKQYASIEIKTYDPQQNKLNDFNLNYGHLSNININVMVLDENNEEFHSANGITNDRGLFETEFYIPERYPRENLTVTITAEDNDSRSSKLLQMFTLGETPSDGSSSP
ncbi:hypothetical protein [Nitrosopumilus maritimus]|uniref:Uncharacterized protein n=1 Tax=Nitrosopumilus maritimus (strain SCM1) TaxID=436308 RepID=A9A5L5_NITMS|nr:hypothetical protein [Nitrosopumilus maritimus]ABX12726.1 hypothetical protein Nmar_0830 [Nitrosopumilus maritimus SCM1]